MFPLSVPHGGALKAVIVSTAAVEIRFQHAFHGIAILMASKIWLRAARGSIKL